jgi:uncharacterized integral membrane protein
MALGGIAFGALVLVVGILFFLVNQKIISITFDFWTVCSLGLIFLGIVIIGGTVWARAMMRGRWRRWMDWGKEM